MTLDHAVALTFAPELSRVGLTDRLRAADPSLIEIAEHYLETSRKVRSRFASRGVHALAWNDPGFPPDLLATPDAPPALWYRGDLAALDGPGVAIVGSRAASEVSIHVAVRLGAELAGRGITVVSGLARGVDAAAHRGALRAGRTMAVLGSGLDRIYPSEHVRLASDISKRGLVVTEYPPDTPPLAFHFPQRNRIISGLSRAVVVIEASEQSGSLITARWALDQGREVMAVPGNVLSGRNRGGHALIRDGAKIVECADDIVSELRLDALPPLGVPRGPGAAGLEPGLAQVLNAMEPGEPLHADALAGASGLGAALLLQRLLDLELLGLVTRLDGGRFVRPW